MQNLKKHEKNELIYKIETYLEKEFMVAKGKGIVREFEMDRYTLLNLKWITNKDLFYRVEVLLSVTWQLDGRGVWERMDTCICICMAESLCCLSETIRTLLIGYTPIYKRKSLIKVLD